MFADLLRGIVVNINNFVAAVTSAAGPIASTWNAILMVVGGAVLELASIFDSVGNVFDAFFDTAPWRNLMIVAGASALYIQNAFSALFDGSLTIEEFGKRLGTALTNLATMIGNAIKSPEFADLAQGLTRALRIDDIGKMLQGFVASISTAFSSVDWGGIAVVLGSGIITLLYSVIGAFASVDWGSALSNIGFFWGDLVGAVIESFVNIDWGGAAGGGLNFAGFVAIILQGLVNIDWAGYLRSVGNLYQGFIQGLMSHLKNINWSAHLSAAGNWLWGAIQWVVGSLATLPWAAYLSAAGDFLVGLGTWVANQLAKIPWGTYLQNAATMFLGLMYAVITAIRSINWGGLASGAATLFAALVAGITAAIQSIDWSDLATSATTLFAAFVTSVMNAIQSIDWGAIATGAATLFAVFVTNVTTAIQSIDWGAIGNNALTIFSKLIAAVQGALTRIDWAGIANGAVTIFNKLVNAVIAGITSIDWGGIITNATTIFAKLVTAVTTAIQSIDWGKLVTDATTVFATLVNSVIAAVTSLDWGKIATDALTIFTGFVTAVIAAVTSLDWGKFATGALTIFATLVNSVITAVTSLDWGKIATDAATIFATFATAVADGIRAIPWSNYIQATSDIFGPLAVTIRDALWTLLTTDFISQALEQIDWEGSGSSFMTMIDTMLANFIDTLTVQAEQLDFTAAIAGWIDGISQGWAAADWSGAGSALATSINAMFSSETVQDQVSVAAETLKNTIVQKFLSIDWGMIDQSLENSNTVLADGLGQLGSAFLKDFEMPDWMSGAVQWITDFGDAINALKSFKWPDIPTFGWPDFPIFGWPDLPPWTWPAIPAPEWLGRLLGWNPSVTAATTPGVGTPAQVNQQGRNYSGTGGFPTNLPIPSNGSFDPPQKKAKGGPAKGLTLVGEEGPELVFFGQAAHVLSNPNSLKLLEMLGVQGFADGTTPLPPLPPTKGLRYQAASTGPRPPMGPTINPADITGPIVAAGENAMQNIENGWLGQTASFVDSTTTAMEGAAAAAADAFESAAKNTTDAFRSALESALRDTPGLFGVSQVTDDQMKLAEMGVPQNFADNWLRRLTDEVMNGVDWEGVDIKDAAKRGGIDPNLPNEVILEMVKQMWADSSLFADPKNLELIDMQAVGDTIAKQAAAQAGQANIMSLFGLGPDGKDAQAQAAQAATSMLNGFAATLQSGAMESVGQQTMIGLANGMGNITPEATTALTNAMSGQMSVVGDIGQQEIASNLANNIGTAIGDAVAQSGTADNFTGALSQEMSSQSSMEFLKGVGAQIAEYIFIGYKKAAQEMPWASGVPANGNAGDGAGTSAVAPPTGASLPQNANGTPYWAGGYTIVGEEGPELVRLPSASRIWSTNETNAMLRGSGGASDPVVIEQVHIHNGMDVAQLEYRIRSAQRRRGKR